jgi:methylated-DNA-[protein]-cysteine S-methyltransferase
LHYPIILGGLIISKIFVSIYDNGKLHFAVAVKDGKIIKSILPKSSEKEALDEITNDLSNYILSEEYNSYAKVLCKIYYGKSIPFDIDLLKLDSNGFQKKVLLEVMKIPYGEVKTYKQISEAINSRAYRAVGTAIGKNPLPLIIPCHRVVKSDLSVGGFFGGMEMKKVILQNEGICIVNNKIEKNINDFI